MTTSIFDVVGEGIGSVVEALQIAVAPAEVVGQLVDDRLADLDHKLPAVGKIFFQRPLKNEDAMRLVVKIQAIDSADIHWSKQTVQTVAPRDLLVAEAHLA